jgi:preprotein translocase subunit YajC
VAGWGPVPPQNPEAETEQSDLKSTEIIAQVDPSAATTQPAGQPPPTIFQLLSGPFMPLLLVLVFLWIFVLRGKRKQENERKGMLDSLKKNDRVETIGGLLGTVVEVRDGEVIVKADENNNTKLRFRRSAIHRVISEEEKK